jgi:hypothetical protein
MALRTIALRSSAILAFLFLFHLAVVQDRPLFVAAACFVAAGLNWIGQWRGNNSGAYGWVYAIGGGVAALSHNVADLVALAPALGYLLTMTVFGRTLRPGAEPLITTYSRLAYGSIPPECVSYTRWLTLLWACLMGSFALANIALVLLAAPKSWVLAWTVVSVALMLGLFLGEHALRRIIHPSLPPASLRQTGQVMLRAHFGG